MRTLNHAVAVVKFLYARWIVALCALPFALLVVFARWVIWKDGPPSYALEFNAIYLSLTGSVFVCSMLLSGVLSDYYEAVQLPSEIETTFKNLLSWVVLSSKAGKKSPDVAIRALLDCLAAFFTLLDDPAHGYTVFASNTDRCEEAIFAELGLADVFQGYMSTIRGRASRLRIMRDSSFPLPAYALFDSFVGLTVLTLVVGKMETVASGLVVAALFSFLLTFMSLLIRFLDNPFSYPAQHHTSRLKFALQNVETHPAGLTQAMITPYITSIDFGALIAVGITLQRRLLHSDDADSYANYVPRALRSSDSESERIFDIASNMLSTSGARLPVVHHDQPGVGSLVVNSGSTSSNSSSRQPLLS